MAKSKNGGTRAYIRGRIGSDVYSIGKNGKGQKQQVVRSLAETVANPRSAAQMAGRMYMSTVMQAVSAMATIIDHSFDGAPKGQPSISEFIRLNYALVKADAIAHPASDNVFGLVKYQEKGIKKGAWMISHGSVVNPAALTVNTMNGEFSIGLTADTLTMGGLKAALGFGEDDYITLCGINPSKGFEFVRAHINPALADATVISSANIASVFTFEGNVAPEVDLNDNTITVGVIEIGTNCGIIITKKENGAFVHSTCKLSNPSSPAFTSDVALPTYPTGSEAFLNGGDI